MYETLCKPVVQYSLNGEFVKEWHSMRDITREFGVSLGAIRNCCEGITANLKGYIWMFKGNYSKLKDNVERTASEQSNYSELPGEEWREIPGYEGLYQASNLGRIRSKNRHVIRKDGGSSFIRGKIIKQRLFGAGYYYVSLSRNREVSLCAVHRLVAITFLPNPYNLPEVNHKDEGRIDNRVENLEWCTHQYNLTYGTINQRTGLKLRNNPKTSKPVIQYTRDGIFVAEYPSIEEAHRQTGICQRTIVQVVKGLPRWKTAGGFVWKLKTDTYLKLYETDNPD